MSYFFSSTNSKDVLTKKVEFVSSVSSQPRKHTVTSQKEAICKLASSFDSLQKSQEKYMEMWAEAERKREEAFFKYQEKHGELNKQCELCLMEIMVRSQNSIQQPQPQQQYTQGYSQRYSQYPEAVFSGGLMKYPLRNHTLQIWMVIVGRVVSHKMFWN